MQVDIPHAARSALDTLRSQRLQKQASTPNLGPSPAAASPPLYDTLPASGGPNDPSQLSDHSQGRSCSPPGITSQGRDPSQPAVHALPAVEKTLVDAGDLLDHSKGPKGGSVSDMPPLEDTMMDPMNEVLAMDKHAASAKARTGGEIDSRTLLAPVQDTVDSGLAGDSQLEAGDDEKLIRQAVENEKAGDERSSPAPAEDDDEVLLQSLLAEEEPQPAAAVQIRC